MSKIYHEDLVKIDLAHNGTLHRSFLNRAIGLHVTYCKNRNIKGTDKNL